MKYDFTTLPDRHGQGAAKWEQMYQAKPDIRKDAVPLSVADMEFLNAPEITKGLQECLTDRVLGYTIPREAYYQAVIDWMRRRKGWEVRKEEIVTSPGVIPAMYNAVRAFTEVGDGVLIMTPAYPPFFSSVEKNGREVITSPLINREGEYFMDFDDINRKTRDPKVKMLFLCNPHNPTGRSWKEEELVRLGEICLSNNILVLSDEIHSDLIMPGVKHKVFAAIRPEFADISLICTAPSKTFNLAGMQTSNIFINNEEMRAKFVKEAEIAGTGSMLNILGYEACRIAYDQCEEWLEELLTVIYDNHLFVKDFAREKMPEVVVSPLQGTYLQWLDFRAYGLTKEEIEERNVQQAEVFLDEGYIFGQEGVGFERINLACPRYVLQAAMERLKAVYDPE